VLRCRVQVKPDRNRASGASKQAPARPLVSVFRKSGVSSGGDGAYRSLYTYSVPTGYAASVAPIDVIHAVAHSHV